VGRTPVTSSTIAAIGYDPAHETLEVEFLDGSIYHYFGVPEILYRGLMAATSHGSYLDAHVKKGGFKYKKISPGR
jgi:hypothetical protein